MTFAEARLFSRLSSEQQAQVARAADRRRYRPGDVLCRKGDAGRACYVIISGGVHVRVAGPDDRSRRIFLGPGQVVGEMSLLSGNPVTATVSAAVDTEVYVIPRRVFLTLVDREPALRDALFGLLTERMRHRETLAAGGGSAPRVLLIVPLGAVADHGLCALLFRGVDHYAPGSVFVDTVSPVAPDAPASMRALPALFPPSTLVRRYPSPDGGPDRVGAPDSRDWCQRLLDNWRSGGEAGRALLLVVAPGLANALVPRLEREDLVLRLHLDGSEPTPLETGAGGPAEIDEVYVGSAVRIETSARWGFRVSEEELSASPVGETWNRARYNMVDWLARRITGREVGIALGAGAAAGLAHLGVLEVLEEAGIQVDYACGSSMGGVVALTYAKVGRADRATEMTRHAVGSNDKIRDLTWLPRASLLRGAKRREAARIAMGDATLAEFTKPAAVVAADLVKGDRHVLEAGSGRLAMLATSAIPGIFPPESHEGRLLVDGGLVNRIPVDLLERRRCGVKIAVNVVPSPARGDDDYQLLSDAFDRYFGLTGVIANAWGLLAWWHGASEAAAADILIEPQRGRHAGYDFDAIEAMIAAGRRAAEEKVDLIRQAVASMLRPGTP